MQNKSVKKLIGAGVKIVIAVVVLLFLGLKSLDFFYFTTPSDQWYLAYLGFGLTSGGVVAYLVVFMWDADTDLKKTIAIVMLAVCLIGELLTAGFGLQVDAWKQGGLQMAEADFKFMVLVVQLLGFAHGIALLGYIAGDRLWEAFDDEDKDGIPNYRDADYRGKRRFPPTPAPVNQNASETKQIRPREQPQPQHRDGSERDPQQGRGS